MRGWAVVAVLLAGCKKDGDANAPIAAADASAQAVIDAARARTVPAALRATYGIDVDAGEVSGSTRGAMVLAAPDQLRIDILTPLNTPLAYVASDGAALHAWVQQEKTFYRGDDAQQALSELIGDGVGSQDALAVLTGSLPLPAAEVLDARYDDARGMLRATFAAPEGSQLRAWLGEDGRVGALELSRGQELLLVVDYGGHEDFDGTLLPTELELSIPVVGWSVSLDIKGWDALAEAPSVFSISAPPGATELDLIETLKSRAVP